MSSLIYSPFLYSVYRSGIVSQPSACHRNRRIVCNISGKVDRGSPMTRVIYISFAGVMHHILE